MRLRRDRVCASICSNNGPVATLLQRQRSVCARLSKDTQRKPKERRMRSATLVCLSLSPPYLFFLFFALTSATSSTTSPIDMSEWKLHPAASVRQAPCALSREREGRWKATPSLSPSLPLSCFVFLFCSVAPGQLRWRIECDMLRLL